MRITRKVFTDLAIWQVGFGLCIGAVFPFFVMALGVSQDTALTPVFFAACLLAGVTAGIINQFISHRVVAARLRTLAEQHDARRASPGQRGPQRRRIPLHARRLHDRRRLRGRDR